MFSNSFTSPLASKFKINALWRRAQWWLGPADRSPPFWRFWRPAASFSSDACAAWQRRGGGPSNAYEFEEGAPSDPRAGFAFDAARWGGGEPDDDGDDVENPYEEPYESGLGARVNFDVDRDGQSIAMVDVAGGGNAQRSWPPRGSAHGGGAEDDGSDGLRRVDSLPACFRKIFTFRSDWEGPRILKSSAFQKSSGGLPVRKEHEGPFVPPPPPFRTSLRHDAPQGTIVLSLNVIRVFASLFEGRFLSPHPCPTPLISCLPAAYPAPPSCPLRLPLPRPCF